MYCIHNNDHLKMYIVWRYINICVHIKEDKVKIIYQARDLYNYGMVILLIIFERMRVFQSLNMGRLVT